MGSSCIITSCTVVNEPFVYPKIGFVSNVIRVLMWSSLYWRRVRRFIKKLSIIILGDLVIWRVFDLIKIYTIQNCKWALLNVLD